MSTTLERELERRAREDAIFLVVIAAVSFGLGVGLGVGVASLLGALS
ncbi:hypothetical protein [Stenotrophomonas pictorum]|nr:hypothetical protein [Stenotrophomonas pictorum]